ncbi:hypothetical protein [Pseudoalteromonas sp. NBT06-2]|nr:hypothetical protein [Pseudoalteromonas sp. NBT06-2]
MKFMIEFKIIMLIIVTVILLCFALDTTTSVPVTVVNIENTAEHQSITS